MDQVQETEESARLVDAAVRLRAVREAQRRFIALWNIEQELQKPSEPTRSDERCRRSIDGLEK
jgi:hypothetical protein